MTTTAFWCAGELRTEQAYGLHPRAAAARGRQTDLAELRRCANSGCQRHGVPMVQVFDLTAAAYQCRSCGQFDHGG